MSGGGLNYLQNQDLHQLSVNSDLAEAIAYLKTNPQGGKALKHASDLRDILQEASTIHADLTKIWEALDKYLSNDWSVDDVNNALNDFNKKHPEIRYLEINIGGIQIVGEVEDAAYPSATPDRTLFKLIAQNTENLHELEKELRLAEGADNIQKLAAAIASLADAQSKLVAIAQTQEPNCKRILDYAEHLANDQESTL
jgi:ATP phosphoribosyltransferase regulatory subunit HisZ